MVAVTLVSVAVAPEKVAVPPLATSRVESRRPLLSSHDVKDGARTTLPAPRALIAVAPPLIAVAVPRSTCPPDIAVMDKVPLYVPPVIVVSTGKLSELPSPIASSRLVSLVEFS